MHFEIQFTKNNLTKNVIIIQNSKTEFFELTLIKYLRKVQNKRLILNLPTQIKNYFKLVKLVFLFIFT